MKFIIGKKIEMTQVFKDDGTVVPVTRVKAGPCQVTQIKNTDKDKVTAVQIGFGVAREKNIKKPQRGHLKGLDMVKFMRDFSVDSKELENVKKGDKITVKMFSEGDVISVTGTSKGRGFQGVVKRHNFKGGPASHGHKDQLRMPGSIGATGPQKVFKGTRMGGRMGGDAVTVKNLHVVEIDEENNELLIKGAVPGARNGLLIIKAEGELKVEKDESPVEKVVVKEETKTEDVEILKQVQDDNNKEKKMDKKEEAVEVDSDDTKEDKK